MYNIFSSGMFIFQVKKIISIQLLLLIIFSGIRLNIATHYCQNIVAAKVVSLSGKLASCGMESPSRTKSQEDLFTRHCCDDIVRTFTIAKNYFPSSISSLQEIAREVIYIFIIPVSIFTNGEQSVYTASGETRPPGLFYTGSVEQQVICIFRI